MSSIGPTASRDAQRKRSARRSCVRAVSRRPRSGRVSWCGQTNSRDARVDAVVRFCSKDKQESLMFRKLRQGVGSRSIAIGAALLVVATLAVAADGVDDALAGWLG